MTYQSDRMNLNCIQKILIGKCNDILICQDESSDTNDLYTVLVLKTHNAIKRFISACAKSDFSEEEFMVDHFSVKGQYVLVFPYLKKRPLKDFYVGEALRLEESEKVCQELILSCIQSGMPYPLLYLVIKQSLISLNKDLSVYLNYEIDLEEFDESITEKDCVVECARILLSLYESKQKQKAISYTLLQKKISSYGYSKFTELYRDITITAAPRYKFNLKARLNAFWFGIKDSVFGVVLVLCIFLIIVAALSFVSMLIWGDIPWLSILINNFKQIGTESLNK